MQAASAMSEAAAFPRTERLSRGAVGVGERAPPAGAAIPGYVEKSALSSYLLCNLRKEESALRQVLDSETSDKTYSPPLVEALQCSRLAGWRITAPDTGPSRALHPQADLRLQGAPRTRDYDRRFDQTHDVAELRLILQAS